MFRPRPISGFTLIELLTAIAIISTLAAMLLPVLGRARERSNACRCLSNESQLGKAMLIYVHDWDDTYPSAWFDNLGGGDPYNWKLLLLSYLSTPDVFRCPTNPVADSRFDQPAGRGVRISLCYVANRSTIPEFMLDGSRVTSAADLTEPADTIMILENRTRWADQGVWAVDQRGDDVLPPEGYSQPETMGPFNSHSGLVNIVFMDGHARALPLAHTLTPKEMWRDNLRDPATVYNQEWCTAAASRLAAEYATR